MNSDDIDKYIRLKAEDLAKTIDFELMANLLCDSGWTKIELNRIIDSEDAYNITPWLNFNLTGKVHSHRWVFVFEHAKDATAFALRFS